MLCFSEFVAKEFFSVVETKEHERSQTERNEIGVKSQFSCFHIFYYMGYTGSGSFYRTEKYQFVKKLLTAQIPIPSRRGEVF